MLHHNKAEPPSVEAFQEFNDKMFTSILVGDSPHQNMDRSVDGCLTFVKSSSEDMFGFILESSWVQWFYSVRA